MNPSLSTIAILGGTGALGTGLARRWCQAGHPICIGSRTRAKADTAAQDLQRVMAERGADAPTVRAMENRAAAETADIAVLTVPFAHQAAVLRSVAPALDGKILVDATVPLQQPPLLSEVRLPPEGSAAACARALLGERVRLVSAFQNVAAHHLQGDGAIACDVLVCGDDTAACDEVIALAAAAGMRGLHAGKLANAAAAEALTVALIHINRRHRCRAGIRVTGLDT